MDVLTLDGMVSMKVPAGTQPDEMLLLRNKGIRMVNSATRRGHQHVKLKVQIPKTVTPRQKELIEEFGNPAAYASKNINSNSSSSSSKADKSGSGSSGASSCNTNSYIEQAWKRVREYLGPKEKNASESAGGTSAKSKSSTDSKANDKGETAAEAKATAV